MKKIVVRRDVTAKLANMFGVSVRAVAYALNYVSKSERADKIRNQALEMGGQVYEIKLAKPERPAKPVKVLDRKGNVVRTINA